MTVKLLQYSGTFPCDFCKERATLRGECRPRITVNGIERPIWTYLCEVHKHLALEEPPKQKRVKKHAGQETMFDPDRYKLSQ